MSKRASSHDGSNSRLHRRTGVEVDWPRRLERMINLQMDLKTRREQWSKNLIAELMPVDLVKLIELEVFKRCAGEDEPRLVLRQFHALGLVSKCWSVAKPEAIAALPTIMRARKAWFEYLMLEGRGGPQLNARFSEFVASRAALDDPHWAGRTPAVDLEPAWFNRRLQPPPVECSPDGQIPESEAEGLQELHVGISTAVPEQTVDKLALCTHLHTVRLAPDQIDTAMLTGHPDLKWLARLEHLKSLHVDYRCQSLAAFAPETLENLSYLSLSRYSYNPQYSGELDSLPHGIELDIKVIDNEVLPTTPDSLSTRITGFHASPMSVPKAGVIGALPVTLKKLGLRAYDLVLELALQRFTQLTELEFVSAKHATLAPLHRYFASPCSLRKLSAHVTGNTARDLLLALQLDRSLVHLTIGPLTNKPSLKALIALIGTHPMTSLVLEIGPDLATAENVQPILHAIQQSEALHTFTLMSKREIEPELEAMVGAFDLEASSLLDFSVTFDTWNMQRRSLKW